jgi:hypothetical protein
MIGGVEVVVVVKRSGRKKRIGIMMKEKKQIVKNRNIKTENKKWKRNLLSEFLFLFLFYSLFFSFFLNVSFLSISVSHGGRIKMEEKQNYFRTRVA